MDKLEAVTQLLGAKLLVNTFEREGRLTIQGGTVYSEAGGIRGYSAGGFGIQQREEGDFSVGLLRREHAHPLNAVVPTLDEAVVMVIRERERSENLQCKMERWGPDAPCANKATHMDEHGTLRCDECTAQAKQDGLGVGRLAW